jgi:hypothetical protein
MIQSVGSDGVPIHLLLDLSPVHVQATARALNVTLHFISSGCSTASSDWRGNASGARHVKEKRGYEAHDILQEQANGHEETSKH